MDRDQAEALAADDPAATAAEGPRVTDANGARRREKPAERGEADLKDAEEPVRLFEVRWEG